MLSDSADWDPEPTVVKWARSLCDSCSSVDRSMYRARPTLNLEGLDDALAAGADINASGYQGETALHIVAKKLRFSTIDSEGRHLAQLAWHHLVARGAESSAFDIEGSAPLDKLSGQQCRDLLATKRRMYSARRYERTRLGPRPRDEDVTERLYQQELPPAPSDVQSQGVSSEANAFRTPRRPTTKRGSSTTAQTASTWMASLRTPRSTSMSSPATPRRASSSERSRRSLWATPDSHREKERVYFTPPPRALPNWES